MAERVFFLNTLRAGVVAREYEDWVRRVDYPVARAQPAIEGYTVVRLDGVIGDGTAPCQYLEVLEVTSVEEYRRGLEESAELGALLEEWKEYVGESVAIHGTVV